MEIIKNTKVGDVLSEDIIFQYIEQLHNEEDFIDGDIVDRIEEYEKYELQKIELDDIDLDEFQLDEELAEEFGEIYKKTDYYPPIVIDENHRIIDGNHRGDGLKMIGEKYVLAFVGI